jgi:hypothetical protein
MRWLSDPDGDGPAMLHAVAEGLNQSSTGCSRR